MRRELFVARCDGGNPYGPDAPRPRHSAWCANSALRLRLAEIPSNQTADFDELTEGLLAASDGVTTLPPPCVKAVRSMLTSLALTVEQEGVGSSFAILQIRRHLIRSVIPPRHR